ncbi:MAG: isocitrate lyase/phosphoenolpyruvate mutase family protein [Ruminococcus sp.]
MNRLLAENRRGMLRKCLAERPFIRAIETVNGLEALAVRDAESHSGKTFDALWFSGLCCAAFKGKPDNEFVDMSEKKHDIEDIFSVSEKPVIIDMDTGGITSHFCRHVADLERMGVSAVVIEDKTGVKHNSLYGQESFHTMENADLFADKIRQAKQSTASGDFMIFARIESFIAGESLETALYRADRYISAGADGIVIHSIRNDGRDAFAFAEIFKKTYTNIPLAFIPTAYGSFTDKELHGKGADIIIYANHLMRSAYKAMTSAALTILENGRADEGICEPVKTILEAIDQN